MFLIIIHIGITIESEYLDVNKYRSGNIDSYECVADNGVGEPLRKSIKVSFMGRLRDKFTGHSSVLSLANSSG